MAKKCKKATGGGGHMETLGLMFKTLWAPGEAMFLLSKRPRALLPLVLMGLVSLGVGIVAI